MYTKRERTPVNILIVLPTKPISVLLFHKAKNALYAAFSNLSSPVRRLRVPNSRIREPAPAVPNKGVSECMIPIESDPYMYREIPRIVHHGAS